MLRREFLFSIHSRSSQQLLALCWDSKKAGPDPDSQAKIRHILILSCSMYSVVRWRDDRRRGPGVYFFRRQPHTSCKTKAHDLRGQARTKCKSNSVPQDNPLDSRSQLGTAHHTTDTNMKGICFLSLYNFESQFQWPFIIDNDVYELLTAKSLH